MTPKWVVGKHQVHREGRVARLYGKSILIWDKCEVFARYPNSAYYYYKNMIIK